VRNKDVLTVNRKRLCVSGTTVLRHRGINYQRIMFSSSDLTIGLLAWHQNKTVVLLGIL